MENDNKKEPEPQFIDIGKPPEPTKPAPAPVEQAAAELHAAEKSEGYDEASLKSEIDSISRKVTVRELASRGKKEVKVIKRSAIMDLIQHAVKNAVSKYATPAVPADVIEQESQKEFAELYEQFKNAAAVQTELEQKKNFMSKELDELKGELEIHKKLSDKTISEEEEKRQIVAFKEFEFKIEKVIAKIIERKKAGTNIDPAQLEAELKPIIEKLAKETFTQYAPSAYLRDRTIALLEKRIERLYEYAASLENVLKMLASQKLYTNSQIATLLRNLGLIHDDPNHEKKKEMLKFIADQNVKLRKDIKAMGGGDAPAATATVTTTEQQTSTGSVPETDLKGG